MLVKASSDLEGSSFRGATCLRVCHTSARLAGLRFGPPSVGLAGHGVEASAHVPQRHACQHVEPPLQVLRPHWTCGLATAASPTEELL